MLGRLALSLLSFHPIKKLLILCDLLFLPMCARLPNPNMGESSPSKRVSLYSVYLKQDDPKKNTVVRLAKFHAVHLRKSLAQCPRKALILDPFASKVFSFADRPILERFGLIVIDCSWAKTETIFQKPFRTGRCLPHLLAANPINYGKWDRLSSAEALAAGLFLTGFMEQGQEILAKFAWGSQFWVLNEKYFPTQ